MKKDCNNWHRWDFWNRQGDNWVRRCMECGQVDTQKYEKPDYSVLKCIPHPFVKEMTK